MTEWSAGFMPEDGQLFKRTMGEVLAVLVRKRWPQNTAKHLARTWDIDPATATNVTKGSCSERTLAKAIRAEGWALLEALGTAMTGQTHAEWEEARLTKIIEEANHAAETIRRLRTRSALLAERAAEVDEARVLQGDLEAGAERHARGPARQRTRR